jgi:hypothetical protein
MKTASNRGWSFENAKDALLAYFFELHKIGDRVFTRGDLKRILLEHRGKWKVAKKHGVGDFIEFLLGDKGFDFHHVELTSELNGSTERFVLGTVSPYQVGLSLKPRAYLTHGTGVFLHGLTDEIPKTIYVNHEQRPKVTQSALSQTALELAFSRPQRMSRFALRWGDYRFVLINGKATGRLEVGTIRDPTSDGEVVSATKLERTLIDIVVRPAYAGGIYQVLQAYRRAKESMSSNVLVATLKKLEYVYPYHQAIGFLMERAGYEKNRYARLRTLGLNYDFYLVHGMKERLYDKDWRLFYPKGIEA